MSQPWPKRAWYQFCRGIVGILLTPYLRCRWDGVGRVPSAGPVLLVANHQSNLDPMLVGVGCRRRLSYLARKTLFVGPLGPLFASCGAIPVDQEGDALAGLKETLRRLKRGEGVLIFPEGSRTGDGRLGPLFGGFAKLARRVKAPILPIGIAGAYQSWPRSRWFPRPGRVAVHFGQPIPPEEVAELDDDGLTALVRDRVTACMHQATALRQGGNAHPRSGLRQPCD